MIFSDRTEAWETEKEKLHFQDILSIHLLKTKRSCANMREISSL